MNPFRDTGIAGPLQTIFNVRRDEVAAVAAAIVFFFLILTALMLLRPARDALGMERGIESIRWLFIGTAVVTLAVNPVFGWLVARLQRLQFIAVTYAAFALSLTGFWALLAFAPEAVGTVSGQVFYVWFSVFNLFVSMVFWALMADRFDVEQSKRLFGLIAVGGTLGAIFGPWLTKQLAPAIGTPPLLLVTAGLLVLAIAAAWALARTQPADAMQGQDGASAPPPSRDQARIGGGALAGIRAVLTSRYLLGIAGYVVILSVMVTFIYFTRLQMVEAAASTLDERTELLATIDMWTQIAVLVLQLSLTGHLMKRLGVPFALALLPVTMALGFIGLAVFGSFLVLILLEAVVRAVQRAITRPARETLFTVVGREDKYKAKAFIDTFVYRVGDVTGAQVEGGLGRLGMGLAALTSVAVPLALAWAALGIWLGRAQRQRSAALRDRAGDDRAAAGTL